VNTTTPDRKVVLVTRKTRLETLIARFHTRDQARFYVEHLGADFGDYEREHRDYASAHHAVVQLLQEHGRWQAIDRGYLPNFLFGPHDVVVALGQDGLVANTMKYLDGHPLVGINPDPQRYDGILLPFTAQDFASLLGDVLADRRPDKRITMAEARLPDGQRMLAVNDLFIGPPSHTSARYAIDWAGKHEQQSSSGVIVSTGLGSTGWMSSVVAGSIGIDAAWHHTASKNDYQPMPWDANKLLFAVREPFPSRTTGTSIVFGECDARSPLRLTSHMPVAGVIFSDGIEADHLDFGAGLTVRIQPADRAGRLTV
jgi:NAD kinase